MYANLSTTRASSPTLTMAPMLHLRTLDLSLTIAENLNFDVLKSLFRAMPALQHLTMELCPVVTNASDWQALVQTSLPHLVELTLWLDQSRWDIPDHRQLLESFQTSFWIQYETFCFIVVDRDPHDCLKAHGHDNWECMNPYRRPLQNAFVAPVRPEQTRPHLINKFRFIKLSTLENREMPPCYFEDVDSLLVDSSIPRTMHTSSALIDRSRIT